MKTTPNHFLFCFRSLCQFYATKNYFLACYHTKTWCYDNRQQFYKYTEQSLCSSVSRVNSKKTQTYFLCKNHAWKQTNKKKNRTARLFSCLMLIVQSSISDDLNTCGDWLVNLDTCSTDDLSESRCVGHFILVLIDLKHTDLRSTGTW